MKFNSLFTHNVKSVLYGLSCCCIIYRCVNVFIKIQNDGKKYWNLRYSSISIHRTEGGEKLCCFVFITKCRWGFLRRWNKYRSFIKDLQKSILQESRMNTSHIISIPFRLLQHIYFPTSCALKIIAVVMKVYVAIWKLEFISRNDLY